MCDVLFIKTISSVVPSGGPVVAPTVISPTKVFFFLVVRSVVDILNKSIGRSGLSNL